MNAADPSKASELYLNTISEFKKHIQGNVQKGEFGAHMLVDSVNDGPVTIWLDSKNKE